MDLKRRAMQLGVGLHSTIYKLSDGRVGASMAGQQLVLLTTKGRTTGKARTTPLMRVDHEGHRHVIASAGGADTDPGWLRNLVAEPRVGVRDGDETFVATAEVLGEEERAAVYAAAEAATSQFTDYREGTERVIPVVRLHPE